MAQTPFITPSLGIVVLDFETAGSDPEKHAATELAVTVLDTKTLSYQRPKSALIQPYYNVDLQYDEKIMLKTGITIEMLHQKGVDIKQVMKMFTDLAESANPTRQAKYKPILGGHNVTFDTGFLIEMANFCKVDLSKYINGYKIGKVFVPESIDTQKLAMIAHAHDSDLVNHKLATVAQFLGVDYSDGHRATHDVVSTADVLIHYFTRMKDNFSGNVEKSTVSQKKRYSLPL